MQGSEHRSHILFCQSAAHACTHRHTHLFFYLFSSTIHIHWHHPFLPVMIYSIVFLPHNSTQDNRFLSTVCQALSLESSVLRVILDSLRRSIKLTPKPDQCCLWSITSIWLDPFPCRRLISHTGNCGSCILSLTPAQIHIQTRSDADVSMRYERRNLSRSCRIYSNFEHWLETRHHLVPLPILFSPKPLSAAVLGQCIWVPQ